MGDHWYRPDGSPCHTVPRARGEGERATTLADARKLGLLPSVTTILSIVDKPQLTQWKITEALKLARVVPPMDTETPEEYAARIIERSYDETAGAAADEGSRIHAAIEAFYAGEEVPEEYTPHVEATVKVIDDAFPGITDWVPERRVVSPLGYAGTCDLHSPSAEIVIDFKCKAFAPDEKKKMAFDQHRQLAAYGAALFPFEGGPLACANVFVSRTHPGHARLHPWGTTEVQQGWAQFRAAFDLWKLERGYDPQARMG
jgi:hypothetical protein